ncbi:hypothetical protein FO519_008386 [Halicephalobus sp. NKZ332]|nr:hypothetical protein FO519_008386 [Halicephalobus sp. NKZ332]
MAGDRQKPIFEKIREFFGDEQVLEMALLLHHLANNEEKSNDLNILEMLLDSPKQFKSYCDTILAKIDEKEREEFALNNLRMAQYMDFNLSKTDLIQWAEDNKEFLAGAGSGIAKVWCSLPPESQKQIIVYIGKWVSNYASVIPSVIPKSWALLPANFGTLGEALVGLRKGAEYGLAAIYLTYEALRSIYQWYNGEISGKRVGKNIIDAMGSVTGGLAGGSAGLAVGSFFGPIGAVAGGLVGGVTGSILAEKLIDMLTTKIFDLPKDVAVENAYNYLGVSHRASDKEVNDGYKKLCLKHHPDKGGSREEFIKLQSYMGLIKIHRGEVY